MKTTRLVLPWAVGAFLLIPLAAACQRLPTPSADDDLQTLQGHWVGQGPGGDCSVTISGNALRFRARDDFWFETTFTVPAKADSPQLHATITDESDPEKSNVGTVVVAIYKIEGNKLTFGVVEDFDEPPTESVTGDWDWVADIYHLEKGPEKEPGPGPSLP